MSDYDVVSDVYGDTVSKTLRDAPMVRLFKVVTPSDSVQWRTLAKAYTETEHTHDPKFRIVKYESHVINAVLEAHTRLAG